MLLIKTQLDTDGNALNVEYIYSTKGYSDVVLSMLYNCCFKWNTH